MATLPVVGPRIIAVPGIDSVNIKSYPLQQGAAWRESDFLTLTTVGAVTAKTLAASSSTLLNVAGPVFGQSLSVSSTAAVTNGNITITGVVTAGAPAATYYVYCTYTAAGPIESLPGPEFIISCAAGFTFSVNVATAGRPATATQFAVYASVYEGGELLQQATKVTTNTGTAFTVGATAGALVNSVGVNRSASNDHASIVGIAIHDSQALYETGVGGSFTAGNISNLLGAWANPPTLAPSDPGQGLVVTLVNGQPFEISLLQPWTNALVGAAFGLTLDATGWFVADTGATAVGIINGLAGGFLGDTGGSTDIYARVRCIFTVAGAAI